MLLLLGWRGLLILLSRLSFLLTLHSPPSPSSSTHRCHTPSLPITGDIGSHSNTRHRRVGRLLGSRGIGGSGWGESPTLRRDGGGGLVRAPKERFVGLLLRLHSGERCGGLVKSCADTAKKIAQLIFDCWEPIPVYSQSPYSIASFSVL